MDNYPNTSLSISNLDSITNLENKPIRLINNTVNLFEIEELNENQTLNEDLKTKGQNGNESEFYKLMNLNEDGNSSDYYTEEPCVGDPDFCNMDREEYIQMLNDYIFPQPYEWVLIATHAIVFVIGLIGNALVCIAVYRNHSMRTVTNYFIVNLAVADFMVILICLPPTVLWDVTKTWFFGTAMCKIVLYFQVSLN
ncbi:unnamed protein product [Arctia plantaginis]|uniref:G-protein coupled receptors family 1 profile domain-containing protein n=1 Tax=Arctia plantaginis TaxID=874455 RepID=A0A8S1AJB0_ARCPL|nr:unnamed protein product [Arctia plantaginis]